MTREITFEPALQNQMAVMCAAIRPCEPSPPPEHSSLTNTVDYHELYYKFFPPTPEV